MWYLITCISFEGRGKERGSRRILAEIDVLEIHGIRATVPFLDGCHILRRCQDVTGLAQFSDSIGALRKAPTSMKWKAPLFPEPTVSPAHRPRATICSPRGGMLSALRVGRRLVKESCDKRDGEPNGRRRN